MMNNVKLPTKLQNASMPKATGQEGNALSMLGDQLVLDPNFLQQNPELANLIKNAPEGTTFDQLLAELENGEIGAEKIDPELLIQTEKIDPKLLAQMTKNKLDQNAIEIGETNPDILQKTQQENIPFTQDQLVLKNGQTPALAKEHTQLVNQKSILVNSGEAQSNAEDASRAFMPERKSIFAVNKQQAPQIIQKQTQNQAKAKVENGLMDFNSFMNKQTNATKMNMAKNAYASKDNGSLFAKKIEADAPKLTKSLDQPTMKVTDLILMDNEQSGSEAGMEFGHQHSAQHSTSTTNQMQTTKVFDMNQMNTNQDVINQIQDYIIQAKASNEPTVQMSFAHDELGMVDLVVQKAHGDQISVMINTHSMEGNKFFAKNHSELMQSLTQSGLHITDLKLDTSSNTNTNSNNQDHLSGNNSRNTNQHASDDRQQRNEDSERRQELWNLLNKEAA